MSSSSSKDQVSSRPSAHRLHRGADEAVNDLPWKQQDLCPIVTHSCQAPGDDAVIRY